MSLSRPLGEVVLSHSSSCTLLLAPPAWGKTRLLADLYDENQIIMIFVSPLRALANEFYNRMKKKKNAFLPTGKQVTEDLDICLKKSKGILVVTAEQLSERFWRRLEGENKKVLFVFDEFHLFYRWSYDFRPQLFEVLMMVANLSFPILGLSATMEQKILDKWWDDFKTGVEKRYLIDLGNGKLLNLPHKVESFYFLGKTALHRRFLYELAKKKKGVFLLFCQYRYEVEQMVNLCQRQGFSSIGCVGGEVNLFMEQLNKNHRPDCIISTLCLGHGVNLPEIAGVFINYNIKQRDYWIQMVGRGGRKGEKFMLYHLNKGGHFFRPLWYNFCLKYFNFWN